MKSWKTLAVPVAALALLVAACSGPTTGEAPAAVEEMSAAPSPSPTVTDEPATIEQWTSLVAKERNSYDDVQDPWEEAICSPTTAARGAVDCQAMMITMGLVGDAASITFWDATNPGSEAYMGDPPLEIAELVTNTAIAADEVSGMGSDVDTDCFAGDCVSEAADLHRAWSALGEMYAAWEPYL